MAGQNWQVGICRAYPRRVQTYSGDIHRGIQKSNRASYFGRATEDLAGPLTLPPMSLTIRRTPRQCRGYPEPLLEITDALPLHMVLIPSGTFTMGSPDDEPDRKDNEGPQREVTVPTFFLGRYPVTQAQYEKVMETNPATRYEADRLVAPNKPIVGVSWQDAVEFCDRLAQLTSRPYRLPSEAEWEYACRAGTTTPFYFGRTLTDELANYRASATYAEGPAGQFRNETTPVDHFDVANAFGLSDMHGNVYEWCQDNWHATYEGAPTDGNAWLIGGDKRYKIIRGGSWDDSPGYCRSAFRNVGNPVNRYISIGFRVCCSAPRTLQ
ncbi:formylglycine-generating enzyme family protein [Sphaerothrix gracilis]|uniref:formylglycine-generating enzyme family protein n=1 Tax=Sphaerothrix gracilis TaxID=3151835 RepID=UPI0031FBE08F